MIFLVFFLSTIHVDTRFPRGRPGLRGRRIRTSSGLYIAVVDENPAHEDADKALNNAAVAYEHLQRFVSAKAVWQRIVDEYPQSKFLDDFLFRMAVCQMKSFDFDGAVTTFLRLADDRRFVHSQYHADAICNAAVLLQGLHSYRRAALLFERYAKLHQVKPADRDDARKRAARCRMLARQPEGPPAPLPDEP
jgi:hypothetical protein